MEIEATRALQLFLCLLVGIRHVLVHSEKAVVDILVENKARDGVDDDLQFRRHPLKLSGCFATSELRLLAFGDITRGGKHAQHVAAGVFIDRRVVEHVGQASILVADGQRVIDDKALGEGLLVTFARLVRFSEVIAEIRAGQLLSRSARDGLRRAVDIRDLAVGSDGDERIQTGFDQAAIIGILPAQHGGWGIR